MIPIVNQTPTLILGMDVSHGSPGRADVPSIAAVCLIPSALFCMHQISVLCFHP